VAEWIHRYWDEGFVAVSLLRRTDPTKTAADLGHPYLPQEVVTESQHHDYKKRLKRIEFEKVTGLFDLDTEECKGGVCPVK
jgi:ribonucleoside-triphosphate reductase